MPELVPQERNLEQNPFFLLNKRGRSKIMEIEFARTEVAGNVEVDQLWQVHGSGRIGMPGPVDQDVCVATNVRLHRAGGFSEGYDLDLSLYEIRKLLDWQGGKENYRYIRDSLSRIGRTAIESRHAFYAKHKQTHLSDNINLWTTHFARYEDLRGGQAAERHTLSFSRHYARSFADGYVSYLDVDFYFSLARPGSKRLLRLITACAAGSSRWEVEMTELRGRIPLSTGYTAPSKIEEKLESSHNELYNAGYLSDFTFERREDGIYAIYKLNPRFVNLREDLALEAKSANHPALRMMIAASIPRKVRLRELRKHGPARCYEVAELLPYQKNMNQPDAVFTSICEQGIPDWWRKVARDQIEVQPRTEFSAPEPVREPELQDTDASGGASQNSAEAVEEIVSGDQPNQPPKESLTPDPEAQKLWNQALDIVSQEIDTPSFNVWFEGTVPISLKDNTLTIAVPNAFAKEYIESKFKQSLEAALTQQLTGAGEDQSVTLSIVVSAPFAPQPTKRGKG